MTAYAVTDTEIGAHAKTLVANTADTVTFGDESLPTLEVVNEDGAAAIHFTVDGSAPTVGGAGTYRLPAATCKREVRVPRLTDATSTVVKLISAGTPTYSVSKP